MHNIVEQHSADTKFIGLQEIFIQETIEGYLNLGIFSRFRIFFLKIRNSTL